MHDRGRELQTAHPLGKSPVISDGDRVIHESGPIIDYLIRRHGYGRLAPALGSDAYETYIQWLHYAEGSAMLPLMLFMYVMKLGEAGAPLHPRIESEMTRHLSYVNRVLEGREWLVDDEFTGADIQMSFVGEVTGAFGRLDSYPNMRDWVDRFQARPAVERGGGHRFLRR